MTDCSQQGDRFDVRIDASKIQIQNVFDILQYRFHQSLTLSFFL